MYGGRAGKIMQKRLISICIVGILLFGIYRYAQKEEVLLIEELSVGIVNVYNLKVRSDPGGVLIKILPKGAEVTILAEENGFYRISCQEEDDITEGYVRKEYLDVEESSKMEVKTIKETPYPVTEPESAPTQEQEEVIDQGETDTESLDILLDILREITEYRGHFIELYTSNASEDTESEMIIEEHDFPSNNTEGASLTVYSALSGKHLRYKLHYYGETGDKIINYYLCNNFVWVNRQNNYYSSWTLSAEYSDILYSTINNWIITDDAAYIMHDDGGLDEIDRTQLEIEIPMPDEIAAIEKDQRQIEKFYRVAEEDCGLSHEEAQKWFDIVMDDDVLDGGIREITDLLFDDIDGNGMIDMIIMVQETEMKYMYGTGAIYFYMNQEEPYCFTDEDFPFFRPINICYADLNGDGNVEIAFALNGSGNGAVGDWYRTILSYTGSTMERLKFPSDYKVHDDEEDYYVGINVGVIMEPEPDTYTAYCPYFDESITFQASNIREGESQLEYLEGAPKGVGSDWCGYYDLQVVTWKGRNAIQAKEYLSGEGGTSHCVGWAYFILVWDEQGNGNVADWWVEGNFYD